MPKRIALLLLFVATAAHAESLEEKKFWKQESERVGRTVIEAEKQCGVKLEFEFLDKPGLRAAAEKDKATPYVVCDRVVDLVASLCRQGEDEKQAVAAKIKKIQCGYSNPWTLNLKAGAVVFHGNNAQYNFTDWAKPLLMKKL